MILYTDQAAATAGSGSVEFYSAVSQIIPVLLLAYLFQVRYERVAPRMPSCIGKGLSVVNMLLALNAEAISLVATFEKGEIGGWAAVFTWIGMASLFLAFTLLLLRRILFPDKALTPEGGASGGRATPPLQPGSQSGSQSGDQGSDTTGGAGEAGAKKSNGGGLPTA